MSSHWLLVSFFKSTALGLTLGANHFDSSMPAIGEGGVPVSQGGHTRGRAPPRAPETGGALLHRG